MKFLVDESTGQSVATYLDRAGYDVVSVADIMPSARDEDILHRAVLEDRIVVTNDKDFGELIYRGGGAHRGIILLRLRDERAANKIQIDETGSDPSARSIAQSLRRRHRGWHSGSRMREGTLSTCNF
jgi:predicted nuclease of predicted toxin-antitoxin system